MFNKEDIYLDLDVIDTNDFFQKITKLFMEKGYIKEGYLESILERESKYPTGLKFEGYEVAIPHTDSNFINSQRIAFIRLKNEIKFMEMGTDDSELNVKVIFMLLINKGDEQIKCLTNLMTLLGNKEIYNKLESLNDKDSIYEILNNNYKG